MKQLTFLLATLGLGVGVRAQEGTPQQGMEFFEKKVRPILALRCYGCHSHKAKQIKGDFLLDSREGLLKGGSSGPAVVPGHPEKSLLLKAVRHEHKDIEMPPKGKLKDEEIATIEAWIVMGMPHPKAHAMVPPGGLKPAMTLKEARSFWSFMPPKSHAEPAVKRTDWPKTFIDPFILAKLEEKGIAPAPEAGKRTLIRRLYYGLIGLPPSPEAVEAFLADDSTGAYERVIDDLLASPRYGERWGRHWLDVARYADTKEWVVAQERRLPYSYTYRDWVIGAFNEDLPYDVFLKRQIAADLLPSTEDVDALAALGFITVGRTFLNKLPDQIDDRLDVTIRGLQGLTISCARCHDHKYDPITMRDYYGLYGVFAGTETPKDLPLIGGPPKETAEYKAYKKELQGHLDKIEEFKKSRLAQTVAHYRKAEEIEKYLLAATDVIGKSEEEIQNHARGHKLNRSMLVKWEASLRRARDKKDPVFAPWFALAALKDANPRVREALGGTASLKEAGKKIAALLAEHARDKAFEEADREALRQAIAGAASPTHLPFSEIESFLTRNDRNKIRAMKKKVDGVAFHPGAPPRAMALMDKSKAVEPVIFLRGNPGRQGKKVPRQYLDVLSHDDQKPFSKGSGRLEMAEKIASAKNPLTARVWVNRVWMHHFGEGLVRTPSDFGTRGEAPTHPMLLDTLAHGFVENGWSTKKLHKKILMSAVYRQSTREDRVYREIDGENRLLWRFNLRRLELESMRDTLLAVAGRLDTTMGGRAVKLSEPPFSRRRTVYGYVDRLNLANLFKTFDFAIPDQHAPKRHVTSVPQQTLYLMNDPFVMEQARALMTLPEIAGKEDPSDRIRALYRRLFARAPTATEVELGREFVGRGDADRPAAKDGPAPLTAWERYAHVLLQSNELHFLY